MMIILLTCYLIGALLTYLATIVFFPSTGWRIRILGAVFWPILLIVLLLTSD